jgi:intracellular sulfur oxidation DsrE/DsrF family protein
MKKKILLLLLVLCLFFGLQDGATTEHCLTDDEYAEGRPNDREALAGIEIGRIFWDVTVADPAVLDGRLGVIQTTYQDMVRQNVTPEMILAFRGGAVRLLAADLNRIPEGQRVGAAEVQARLTRLLELPGVRVEACYIAMRRIPLEPENMIRGVHTVNNTFLSAMGYGQKGYVSIPIH